jgi:DNA topoisomerase-2
MNSTFIEDKWVQKKEIAHIRSRPDMYLGGNKKKFITETYIYNNDKIILKKIKTCTTYINAINEIYTNAIDHGIRTRIKGSENDYVKNINLSIKNDEIIIINDGYSIGIEKNKDGIYIPEAIYTTFRSGRNFNDKKTRYVGGKNGFGAALTTACSDYLKIYIIHKNIKYTQIIKCDGKKFLPDPPKIEKNINLKDITRISFKISKEMTGDLSIKEILPFLKKRLLETQLFIPKINLYFCNKLINKKKLIIEHFVNKYCTNSKITVIKYGKINNFLFNWKIACWCDETKMILSYVNGLNTSKGGFHVKIILTKLSGKIFEKLPSTLKKNIKKSDIKNLISLIIILFIDKPDFSSQSKDELKTNKLPIIEIDEKKINEILKKGLLKKIKDFINNTKGKNRKAKKNPIVDNYLKAGKLRHEKSSLILTEGESAKSQAEIGIEGLSPEESKYYGMLSLNGKPINPQKKTKIDIKKNVMINKIADVIGINDNINYKEPKEFKKLNYKKVIILADADPDGYHIVGLIINIFYYKWPSLFERVNFIKILKTPCIRLYLKNKIVKEFWTLTQFNQSLKNFSKKYTIKYFKGIGSNSGKEMKNTMKNISEYLITFDISNFCKKSMINSFGKFKKDENIRKKMLSNYDPNTLVEYNLKKISYKYFNNNYLIQYFNYCLKRSIPNIMDGLKPVQRKIIWYMLNNNGEKEIKSISLVGAIIEKTLYSHGDDSMYKTIGNLAQSFTNANNLALLNGSRGFGSRRNNIISSKRYSITKLNKWTKFIFRKEDDCILNFVDQEGKKLEPIFYIPIIPLILINGTKGVGVGYSTEIPKTRTFNIIKKIINRLNNDKDISIFPWYRDYKNNNGIKETKNNYETFGIYTIKKDTIFVTELPLKIHELDFQKKLRKIQLKKIIKDYKRLQKNNGFEYKIKPFKGVKNDEVLSKLELKSTISKKNMNLFELTNGLKNYNSLEEIFDIFYKNRLIFYEKRKKKIIEMLKYDLLILSCKIKFIKLYINKKIKIEKEKIENVIKKIEKLIENVKLTINHDKRGKYAYLYYMPIIVLTEEEINRLNKKLLDQKKKLFDYEKKTIKGIWLDELNELLNCLKTNFS